MRYMTDAHIANVARVLRDQDLDCETVHKRMRGNEESSVQILDPEIVQFLMKEKERGEELVLICNDKDLAGHCKVQGLAVIYVPDLVLNHIKGLAAEPGL